MIIGITMSISKDRCLINQAYVDYIIGAKMEPLLIPPGADLDIVTEMCDGSILPGGVDLDPTFYGASNVASFGVDPKRDEFERRVLYAFLRSRKPVFGICRGFQLIAREYIKSNSTAELWLQYWQHIPSHSLVEEMEIPRTALSHRVRYLSYLYGAKRKSSHTMFVNSMHHQSLLHMSINKRSKIDNSFTILAETTLGVPEEVHGDIIEAFRIKNDNVDVLAVQWHPEELKDYKLIQSFFGVEVQEEDTVEDVDQSLLEVVHGRKKRKTMEG